MKTIYIDLETTNLSPLKAEIIEFCVLFVENYKVKDKITKFIKFNKKWEELSESDISALNFNKIYNQEDLNKHNSKAFELNEILNEFFNKLKEFSENKKIEISGWNAAYYDITILERMMERYNFIYYDYFNFFPRDIKCMFLPFYDLYFKDKIPKSSLHPVHKYLIGTFKDEDFHKAEIDCLATLDIDKWIYKNLIMKK